MRFEEVYHQFKKVVFNLALQYTQNIEDAEEITHDVFVKVHQKLHTFKEQSSLKTWIYRITINQSLDYIKSKNTKKRFSLLSIFRIDHSETHFDLPHFNHPGVILEHKESLKRLFDCLNQLPDNQKTVIILLKIELYSQLETSEIMGKSVKAVESLFQRAKKNLENLLDK